MTNFGRVAHEKTLEKQIKFFQKCFHRKKQRIGEDKSTFFAAILRTSIKNIKRLSLSAFSYKRPSIPLQELRLTDEVLRHHAERKIAQKICEGGSGLFV